MEIFYSDSFEPGASGGVQGSAEAGASGRVGGLLRLDAEESAHCVRVLRHRVGDSICVVDGRGTMYRCTIESTGASSNGGDKRVSDRQKNIRAARAGDDSGCVTARIDSVQAGWHSHPYNLTMAVCPTKNPDRYEWMVEKLCEIGVDTIAPVIGDRSERRVLKTDRLRRLVLSASKQSLKAAFPELAEPVRVRDFVAAQAALSSEAATQDGGEASVAAACEATSADDVALIVGEASVATACEATSSAGGAESGRVPAAGCGPLRFIAYCSDEIQPRASLSELLSCSKASGIGPDHIGKPVSLPASPSSISSGKPGSIPSITVLIGPEGDFSPEEVRAAMDAGFIPVHLGSSRLRTETAAIVAATAVYLQFLLIH